jgi:hypothetical protein
MPTAEQRRAAAAQREEAERARHEEIRKRRHSTNTVNAAPSPALLQVSVGIHT